MNQTRLTVTTPAGVRAAVTVDSDQLRHASPEAWDGLVILLASVLRRKTQARGVGLDLNPRAWTWTAEPVGPQVRLVALNGSVL